MTYVIGLTGSIGMGKSTTAKMFADEGIPVWDADATVRRLYEKGGAAALAVADLYPDAMDEGAVSRSKLRELIAKDPAVLDCLQDEVHPLVAADRRTFIDTSVAPIVLLDIPLLFETGANADCDGIVVVSVEPDVQRARVLERGEMSEADFEMILSRQIPDAEKRSQATWVVKTNTLDEARASVKGILEKIRARLEDA